MNEPLLEVRGLSKTFPGMKALDDVSLAVNAGEIVALLGQNGSGKSTLVKILAGVHRPDPGAWISLGAGADGHRAELHFIHQDLGLVPTLSTIENLDLARVLGRSALLPSPVRREQQRAEELIAGFGVRFDVRVPISQLTAAERTIVAIARALAGWRHPGNLLILDEPTASLHGEEVGKLFRVVREVAGRGAGVVFISHRLDEVLELAERVVALRDGRVMADVSCEALDHDSLVRLVAGTGAVSVPRSGLRELGKPMLRARNLRGSTIRGLNLALAPGEVVGVSGVIGSGREQVASILFGCGEGEIDELEIDGRSLRAPTPRCSIAAGVAYVPGDRHRQGAVMTMTARENVTLPQLSSLRRRFGRLDRPAERSEVDTWIERLEVRPAQPERSLKLFSGGNQQKLVLAKWLRNDPKVLLLDEPTQGVDIGAKVGIYALIDEAARGGAAVLICSSDARELAQVCDRVLVLSDGELAAEIEPPELNEASLLAAGIGSPALRQATEAEHAQ